MANNLQFGLAQRLEDLDYRREFGAARIMSGLAILLTEARKSRGLTQKELAASTGVSQAYIAKLESGEANPTIGKVGAIFAAMWLRPKFGFEPLIPEGRGNYEDRVLDELGPSGGLPMTGIGSQLPGTGRAFGKRPR